MCLVLVKYILISWLFTMFFVLAGFDRVFSFGEMYFTINIYLGLFLYTLFGDYDIISYICLNKREIVLLQYRNEC